MTNARTLSFKKVKGKKRMKAPSILSSVNFAPGKYVETRPGRLDRNFEFTTIKKEIFFCKQLCYKIMLLSQLTSF
jgi:hypothetical protein